MRTLSYTFADVGLARVVSARAMLRVSCLAREKVVMTMSSIRPRLKRGADSVESNLISPC